jgi:hypothetical protein
VNRLAAAQERARRLYPRAPHFRGAYLDGVAAKLSGGSESQCPYRRGSGWQAWRAAWVRGFCSVEREP